jgi:speckle-type POZ protein
MEHESSPLLQDSIEIRCDMAIVKGITVVQPPPERPDLHRHFGDLLASKVGTDVTFEVAGDLFSAHKCVLATRSTAFMAEFFGPSGKENAGVTQVLRIDNMEPRVFKALLHFIYTDALPEVVEEDKIVMA